MSNRLRCLWPGGLGMALAFCGLAVATRPQELASFQNSAKPMVASIDGVVSGADGRPLVGAQVSAAAGRGVKPRVTTTDDRGRYRLSDLPFAIYTVTAWRLGYVMLAYGQRHPS